MAKPTATGKPTLVIIETQTGRQTQIWYPEGAGFVGCSHLDPVESFDLPDCILSRGRAWKIEDAIDYVTQEKNRAA